MSFEPKISTGIQQRASGHDPYDLFFLMFLIEWKTFKLIVFEDFPFSDPVQNCLKSVVMSISMSQVISSVSSCFLSVFRFRNCTVDPSSTTFCAGGGFPPWRDFLQISESEPWAFSRYIHQLYLIHADLKPERLGFRSGGGRERWEVRNGWERWERVNPQRGFGKCGFCGLLGVGSGKSFHIQELYTNW